MNGEGAAAGVRVCPFCAEAIHADARKCKHCGEFLDEHLRLERSGPTPQTNGYGRTLRHAGWIVFGVGILIMLTVSLLLGLLIAVAGGVMDNRGKAIASNGHR